MSFKGAPIGPISISDNLTAYGTVTLDSVNKKIAMKFTNPYDKTILGIMIRFSTCVSAPLFRFGLQGVADGKPDGNWFVSNCMIAFSDRFSYGACDLPCGVHALPCSLGKMPYKMVPGKEYFVVLEYLSGTVDATHYAKVNLDRSATDGVYFYPKAQLDSSAETLYSGDGGSTWSLNSPDINYPDGYVSTGYYVMPFVLVFNDNTEYGYPYNSAEVSDVRNKHWARLKFKPNHRMHVTSITVDVKRLNNPVGDLIISLQDITNSSTIESWTVAPGDVPAAFGISLTTKTLTTPTILSDDNYYAVELKSPASADVLDPDYKWSIFQTDPTTGIAGSPSKWLGRYGYFQTSDDSGGVWTTKTGYYDAGMRFALKRLPINSFVTVNAL